MKFIRYLYKFIFHIIRAKNSKGHGVHSPYLYAFTQEVIYEKNPFYSFSSIESIRDKLKKNNDNVKITDYGAGNRTQAKISDLAKTSLKNKKWSQLLFRIVNFSKAKNVLELGTSLGITTAYLASASSDIKCVTLEGAPEIAKVARSNFEELNLKNIEVIEGNIDITLKQALSKLETLDVVFFDANHKKIPTLKYFNECLRNTNESSIFVFDDIYWSKGMNEAWDEIKKSDKITATIDLFQIGVVFFNKNLPKKHYVMKR